MMMMMVIIIIVNNLPTTCYFVDHVTQFSLRWTLFSSHVFCLSKLIISAVGNERESKNV